VQRVEILYFPERILVRAALSLERLEMLYQYKLEIRHVRETAEGRRLLSLLDETSVEPSGRGNDHRTAVFLFDQNVGVSPLCTLASLAEVAQSTAFLEP